MYCKCKINVHKFIYINSLGEYEQLSSLDDLDEYSDGTSIGNNKFFNVVFGVAWTADGTARLYGIIQNNPSTEYISVTTAEQDAYNTLNTFPFGDFLKKNIGFC